MQPETRSKGIVFSNQSLFLSWWSLQYYTNAFDVSIDLDLQNQAHIGMQTFLFFYFGC